MSISVDPKDRALVGWLPTARPCHTRATLVVLCVRVLLVLTLVVWHIDVSLLIRFIHRVLAGSPISYGKLLYGIAILLRLVPTVSQKKAVSNSIVTKPRQPRQGQGEYRRCGLMWRLVWPRVGGTALLESVRLVSSSRYQS
jgi:hypothetical protein